MLIHSPMADLGEGPSLLSKSFLLLTSRLTHYLIAFPVQSTLNGVLSSYFNLQSRGKVSRYQEILAQKGELGR